ncbi:sensor histidine kinase [Paraclostridium sordellii]|uniref:sensor histidine kinase n=1 Tax=Paraclostridium sordellii TaxID=1505 RepID=UPI0005DFDC2E|nr:HAMP domain-containing sensor histidine kinase [Paeniclostridium sordellii]CEN24008.1 sensor protein [[Clostridium] sordellii] [Paeniclostridium sordellii]
MYSEKKYGNYDKKLLHKLIITLFLYTILGWVLIVFFELFKDSINDNFSNWLILRLDIIYIIYLLTGYMCIFLHFWKKPWSYLGEIIEGTEIIYRQDESTVKLSEALKPIEDQMNQIKMAVLLANQSTQIAESKKNELVAYLAHDIRTPLTSILGYLSLMKDMPDMPPENRDIYIQTIFEKTIRLEELVNEFFEITQYNTNQIQIKKEEVNLHYMLVQLADEFYPMANNKGNIIKILVDENLKCNIDPDKMSRVFCNLLKNAITYSYPQTEIFISAKTSKGKMNIVFSNKGETISDKYLLKIFEKFSRLDNSRASDTGGAGLGLSIAREIVSLHGGTISVESKYETINFIISIPI